MLAARTSRITLQWGHAFVSVETHGSGSGAMMSFGFNGATLLQAWKLLDRITGDNETIASMGPRFCKRGNKRVVMQDGGHERLQWGHAFVSVETAPGAGRGHRRIRASMGPRFCKRGNWPKMRRATSLVTLQWGHAFVSVETSDHRDPQTAATRASMGPRFCKRGNSISRREASIPPFLAPAARSDATSAYFGRLGRDFAGHFPARRASSPL